MEGANNMRINLIERNYTASERLIGILEKKLNKLNKYFDMNTDAYITLSKEKQESVMEVTIPFSGAMLRAERKGEDMYSLVDEIEEILDRQIYRHHKRLENRLKSDAFADSELAHQEEEEEEASRYDVVRVKRFAVKPMDTQEAIMQMELLGHDFFVFTNAETNEVNVIYRRKDGNVGLIEPDYED